MDPIEPKGTTLVDTAGILEALPYFQNKCVETEVQLFHLNIFRVV